MKLIQRALADHRDIFQSTDSKESECLAALLKVLDLFVKQVGAKHVNSPIG